MVCVDGVSDSGDDCRPMSAVPVAVRCDGDCDTTIYDRAGELAVGANGLDAEAADTAG